MTNQIRPIDAIVLKMLSSHLQSAIFYTSKIPSLSEEMILLTTFYEKVHSIDLSKVDVEETKNTFWALMWLWMETIVSAKNQILVDKKLEDESNTWNS